MKSCRENFLNHVYKDIVITLFSLSILLLFFLFGVGNTWAESSPLYRAKILELTPITYLQFNGNFLDSSESGSYPGNPIGGVTFSEGIPLKGYPGNQKQQAALFDGISGVVTIPGTANLSFTEGATLTAWVNFNKLPSDANISPCNVPTCLTIVAKSGWGADLDLQAESDNRFHFYVGIGAPNMVLSRTTIVPGRWYFVAAVYRPGTMEIYVNGYLEGFRDDPEVTWNENSTDFAIGGDVYFQQPPYNQNRFLPGLIDEVAIFQKALTADQINELYRSATRQTCQP